MAQLQQSQNYYAKNKQEQGTKEVISVIHFNVESKYNVKNM